MTDLEDQAMDLFGLVVGLDRERQCERLAAECAGPGLRARVEELLNDHREADSKAFLEPPLPREIVTGVTADDQQPPDLPGHETLARLDAGGMGVVWRVRDLPFQRLLAVKVMNAAGCADPHRVQRFFDEARITAQLAHPSVVPVHALGRLIDGRPYYTMKLVEGRTLAELLQDGPDAASPRADPLRVFAQVCQALAFAHSKGVIHCDLKPGNVMVGEHGEVQVMDWGEARVLAACDDQSGVGGTWPYMSPEHASGRVEEMDRRSDVFGLGAVLCAILTGQPPYAGSLTAVKRQAREADLAGAYARLEACGADAELVALARDCLSAKPSDRPPDASVVERRLTGYLASVQERLRQAELDRAAAHARAGEEERTRRVAEEKAELERQLRHVAEESEERAREMADGERHARHLAEKVADGERRARRWMRWLAAGLSCTLLALVAAGLFAWQAYVAEGKRATAEKAHEEEKRQNAIDRALTAALSGDLEAAEQAIAEAELAGASTGQVRMVRGQIALHRGQSREAMRHLEQAVRLLPDSVAARGMLAAAYASDGQWERYDRTMQDMQKLSPSTAEDFLFKGYAEANLDPELGLRTLQQAFARRPRMGIARLLRAEVRSYRAQDTDDLAEAEGAIQDARFARELLGDKNPTALWVSLNAHLTKASVHEHRAEPEQRGAALKEAGKDAEVLKDYAALPEAAVNRWLYYREVGREEEVLDELRRASDQTDHVYVAFCYAVTLYRRGQPRDIEEALRVLEKKRGSYNDRLLPFLLAEYDYQLGKANWEDRALEATRRFAEQSQDGLALMNAQSVFYLLGKKDDAVKASKELRAQEHRFYMLRRDPILRCVDYCAGYRSADDLAEGAKHFRWDQCLAHHAIGMTKLSEGDRHGALAHFDKVVKTRAFIWGAYDLSWAFRARLAKDPTWPPWIPPGQAK